MKGNMMNWDLTIPHAILHAEKYNFDGIVCSDWALITDRLLPNGKVFKPASAFGLEDKTTEERITKLIDAGIDMIGGESLTNELVNLIR